MALEIRDIKQEWERVRPGLAHVARVCRTCWSPADVYDACRQGRAVLFMEGSDFCVLQHQTNAAGERELFVWITYAAGNRAQEYYLPQIKEIARKLGAVRLETASPRPGFERRAAATGWKLVTKVYQMEVEP
jgi:hypothetical protein